MNFFDWPLPNVIEVLRLSDYCLFFQPIFSNINPLRGWVVVYSLIVKWLSNFYDIRHIYLDSRLKYYVEFNQSGFLVSHSMTKGHQFFCCFYPNQSKIQLFESSIKIFFSIFPLNPRHQYSGHQLSNHT